MPRKRSRNAASRHPQAGRVVMNMRGDAGEIVYPDRGSQPLVHRKHKYQNRPRDGFGSHMNGRHKMG